ncbi:TIGR01906 family protein [Lentilactobacillus senioris DSM 24302 = JCM 17472]|uniref:TIGR01906 family protein n=1 Tax=Lentilactobacillus senioris DSM 24302 = JCM 17472 TaxID=1423802 RepID=A0A0R2D273_9LACO|nr:TIGR01906 family membrane protein [Lentilactobacillus senioris]KRM93731.1 TIGR01906 family protein [Lentilactobacillus senioris DSM 24302 = JCM 17472]
MLKRAFQALIVFLFIISLAIFVTINSVWLFRLSIPLFHLTDQTGLTTSQMMHEYLKMISYLQLPWQTSLHFDFFASSSQGLQHFKDVRSLVMVNNLVMLISGVASWLVLNKLVQNKQLYNLLNPLRILVTIIIGIAGIMLVNFDQAFIWFHQLFFRNDYWLFDPNRDEVINMLPDGFFALCFLLFGALVSIGILVLLLMIRYQIKAAKKD